MKKTIRQETYYQLQYNPKEGEGKWTALTGDEPFADGEIKYTLNSSSFPIDVPCFTVPSLAMSAFFKMNKYRHKDGFHNYRWRLHECNLTFEVVPTLIKDESRTITYFENL